MKRLISNSWGFRLWGALLAALSASAFGIVFYFSDTFIIKLTSGGIPDPHGLPIFSMQSMIEITVGISILTLIPALMGGCILAYMQQYDAKRGRVSRKRGIIEGAVLGSIAALICSLAIIAFLIFYARRIPSPAAMAIHIIIAIILASLAGSWVGGTLSLILQKYNGKEVVGK